VTIFRFLAFPYGPLVWQAGLGIVAGLLVWLVFWRKRGLRMLLALAVIGVGAVFVSDAVLMVRLGPGLNRLSVDAAMTLLSGAEFGAALVACVIAGVLIRLANGPA
jgi:hypothetical protein